MNEFKNFSRKDLVNDLDYIQEELWEVKSDIRDKNYGLADCRIKKILDWFSINSYNQTFKNYLENIEA